MKKVSVLFVAALVMTAFGVNVSCAATAKCTVTEIKESVVTLDCGKTADKLKVKDAVKVKTTKKQAVEGC